MSGDTLKKIILIGDPNEGLIREVAHKIASLRATEIEVVNAEDIKDRGIEIVDFLKPEPIKFIIPEKHNTEFVPPKTRQQKRQEERNFIKSEKKKGNWVYRINKSNN